MIEIPENPVARILALVGQEVERQRTTLDLIASENHVSADVLLAVGSRLGDKYTEGYPFDRYYPGCKFYDEIESIVIALACNLFGCKFANVQGLSGAPANQAVFRALMKPGDPFVSLVLSDGGHLSHGMKLNVSGRDYSPGHYPLVRDRERPDYQHIDYDAVRAACAAHLPKVLMCGYSAYPRTIDFARFRQIADEFGAILVADIAHIAGLVAGGAHPSPFPHAHVVTMTTHKSLRGARGALILTDDESLAKKINVSVFPGLQGGPHMNNIAGIGIALAEARQPSFRTYAAQVVANAKSLAARLQERGHLLCSGGTDNHLMLVDLRGGTPELFGARASQLLEEVGIIANANTVPEDSRKPKDPSGIRLGTPAVTTRGLLETHMADVADVIDRVLRGNGDAAVMDGARRFVADLTQLYPLPS